MTDIDPEHHLHGDAHRHQEENILIHLPDALHIPGFGRHPHHDDVHHVDNELGIITVKRALLVLALTTLLQMLIYLASGSVALLADTVHNLGDITTQLLPERS